MTQESKKTPEQIFATFLHIKPLIDGIAARLGADPEREYFYSTDGAQRNRGNFYFYALSSIPIDFVGNKATNIHTCSSIKPYMLSRPGYAFTLYAPGGKYSPDTGLGVRGMRGNESAINDCYYDPANAETITRYITENIRRIMEKDAILGQRQKNLDTERQHRGAEKFSQFKPLQPLVDNTARELGADTNQERFYHYALHPIPIPGKRSQKNTSIARRQDALNPDPDSPSYIYAPGRMYDESATFDGPVTPEIIKDCYYSPACEWSVSNAIRHNISRMMGRDHVMETARAQRAEERAELDTNYIRLEKLLKDLGREGKNADFITKRIAEGGGRYQGVQFEPEDFIVKRPRPVSPNATWTVQQKKSKGYRVYVARSAAERLGKIIGGAEYLLPRDMPSDWFSDRSELQTEESGSERDMPVKAKRRTLSR